MGNKLNRRFWQCECCCSLLVTMAQDDAGKYQCPQCAFSGCEHGGQYVEVELAHFLKEAGLE